MPLIRGCLKNEKMNAFLKNLLIVYALLSIIVYMVTGFIAQPFKINGNSMFPTIRNGDLVLISKVSLLSGKRPATGDIVAFFDPADGKRILIKRVKEDCGQGYFVMGDNAESSIDSRVFGTVSGDRIIGKAIIILWPLRVISEICRD
ncbi:MAG: signal peptidase I [Acidobacteriota bacterium]